MGEAIQLTKFHMKCSLLAWNPCSNTCLFPPQGHVRCWFSRSHLSNEVIPDRATDASPRGPYKRSRRDKVDVKIPVSPSIVVITMLESILFILKVPYVVQAWRIMTLIEVSTRFSLPAVGVGWMFPHIILKTAMDALRTTYWHFLACVSGQTTTMR